jgi:hypothetical protein
MSKKVFIYISDVAAFVGQNPYDIVTPFERLWKKCDKDGYEESLEHAKNQAATESERLLELDQKKQLLDEDLKSKHITKRQHSMQMNKIEEEYNQTKSKMDTIVNKIDDIDLTQQQKLQKVIGTELVAQIQSSELETETKRKKVQNILEDESVPEEHKDIIRKHATSFINKSHGTLKEDSAIEMYQNRFGVKLDTSQQFFKKQIPTENSSIEWYICGKMDGIYYSTPEQSYIVEVKNRTRGFFSTLRDYEKTQIQLYLSMINFDKAQLVEKYNNKIRVTSVYKDATYIDLITKKLALFIQLFDTKFLQNESNKIKYLMSNDKTLFLQKLYLSEVSCYSDEVEEDSDTCMIDSDL